MQPTGRWTLEQNACATYIRQFLDGGQPQRVALITQGYKTYTKYSLENRDDQAAVSVCTVAQNSDLSSIIRQGAPG